VIIGRDRVVSGEKRRVQDEMHIMSFRSILSDID
jgi:hypothetical protein